MKTYARVLLPRARAMRREMTKAERRFWFECLRGSPFKFRAQRPFGKFIVDFYCAELKLVIEIDGDTHFNDASRAYDFERTAFLQDFGLQVLRFTNDDVMFRIDSVKNELMEYFKR